MKNNFLNIFIVLTWLFATISFAGDLDDSLDGSVEDDTPFGNAMRAKDKEKIKQLLEDGEDVNKLIGQLTPLHVALLYENDLEIIKLLLDHGADVNKTSFMEQTPLCLALLSNLEMVKLFLDYGADVNKTCFNNNTVLKVAAYKGNLKIVKLLLDHGADVNKANDHNEVPLHAAAYHGHLEIVKLLLYYGADVNKTSNINKTPLYHAASQGHFEIVKLLLVNGANLPQNINPRINIIQQYNKFKIENGIEWPHIGKRKAKESIEKNRMIYKDEYLYFFPQEIYNHIFINFKLNDFLPFRRLSKSHHNLVDNNQQFYDLLTTSICSWQDLIYFAKTYSIEL